MSDPAPRRLQAVADPVEPIRAEPPERLALDPRRPLLLDDRLCTLRIETGYADLFAVPLLGETVVGVRRHLCRVESGGLLLGLPSGDANGNGERVGVVAVGGGAATALILDRAQLGDLASIEDWVSRISAVLTDRPPDWHIAEVVPGQTFDLAAGERRGAPGRGVVWLLPVMGELRLLNLEPGYRAGDPALPLAASSWVESPGDASLHALDREALRALDPWPSIDRFHALVMLGLSQHSGATTLHEARKLERSAEHSEIQGRQLLGELATVIAPRNRLAVGEIDRVDPLLAACRAVGAALGTEIVRPAGRIAAAGGVEDLLDIARTSRLRLRRVLLRRDWWRRDMGPLVAWRMADHGAVALIPVSARRYTLLEPDTGARRKVDAALAAELAPEAAMLYPSLPSRSLSALDLAGFCLRFVRRDAVRIILAALATGALALAMPIIVQILVDSVIPGAELDQLALCAAGLILVAFGMGGMQAAQAAAMLRFEGLLDWKAQAAVIDRLLNLPVGFFRSYTAGDLADRAMGIEAVRRIITGRVIRGLLAGLFSLLSFALMFVYDARLALVAAALALLRGAGMFTMAARRLRHERRHFDIQGRVQGLILQLLTGVGKLRVASATTRGLAVWARLYAGQKRHFVASQRAANLFNVFDLAFPALATVAIFALSGVGQGAAAVPDTGRFLAFLAAFGQSLTALGEMGTAIGESLTALPRFGRVKALLEEPAEIVANLRRPEEMSGAFEVGQVTFRYARSGPPVLKNLTLRVGRGEFVAIVGPSGSGKSTLFRLLLGFEKPEAGAVFFDGKALDTLDVQALRRQIGVVLQNGKLTSGSLYENISAGAQLPIEQAWQAARLAGLDGDIEAMPMGMHTVVAEGVSTLSGGQRQKLMIARALVSRPRILLLDEATSALDNRAQAVVSASLAKLNVTRLVIAHRLSTVQNADRIFVLAGGEVVQAGSFAELSARPGLFADLVERQLL